MTRLAAPLHKDGLVPRSDPQAGVGRLKPAPPTQASDLWWWRRRFRLRGRILSQLGLALPALLSVQSPAARGGGELRCPTRSDPPSFHPALADSDSAETIRYLTGGVLVRVNRSN